METAVQTIALGQRGIPAFEALFQAQYGFVWRCITRLGVPDEAVEDAVQEVFITAYRRRDSYDNRRSARAWLAGIARRVAYRHRRSTERRARRRKAVAEVALPSEDLDRWIERREADAFLQQFLDRLDPDKREMFVLCDLEGIPGLDAARALGVNPNTASARLRAARKAFDKACSRAQRGRALPVAEAVRQASRSTRPPRRSAMSAWAALVPKLSPAASAMATGSVVGLKALVVGGTIALASTAVAMLFPSDGPRSSPLPRSSVTVAAAAASLPRTKLTLPPATVPRPVPPPVAAEAEGPVTPRSVEAAAAPSGRDSTTSSLSDEVVALERATDASERADWPEAARSAASYRHRFPTGAFLDEAVLLEIEALCRLDRRSEAEDLAGRHLDPRRRTAVLERRCRGHRSTGYRSL
jgi:RNA polymerase sigma-70 factor (ECF subfamily)